MRAHDERNGCLQSDVALCEACVAAADGRVFSGARVFASHEVAARRMYNPARRVCVPAQTGLLCCVSDCPSSMYCDTCVGVVSSVCIACFLVGGQGVHMLWWPLLKESTALWLELHVWRGACCSTAAYDPCVFRARSLPATTWPHCMPWGLVGVGVCIVVCCVVQPTPTAVQGCMASCVRTHQLAPTLAACASVQ